MTQPPGYPPYYPPYGSGNVPPKPPKQRSVTITVLKVLLVLFLIGAAFAVAFVVGALILFQVG